VNDLGAGSMLTKSNLRRVSSICRNTSKSRKIALLLHRMVAKYQPATVIELGTSLGISTAYLASGNPKGHVVTMEGSPNIAALASKNFEKLGLANIEIRKGSFDDLLPQQLQGGTNIDFVFIDGNHREEPTLRYFNWLMSAPKSSTILVFDDIHWSPGMEAAWNKIQADPRVRMTIDLFFVGIVLFREEFKVKQDFVIRY
jgi:predicted O-methyltransferase YrrM